MSNNNANNILAKNTATKTAVVTKSDPAFVVPSPSAAACQRLSNIKMAGESATRSASSSPPIHVWRGIEEDMLVSLRHSRNSEFTIVKIHTALGADSRHKQRI